MDEQQYRRNIRFVMTILDGGLITPNQAHVGADYCRAQRQLHAALLAAGLAPQVLGPILADASDAEHENLREIEALRVQESTDKANALRSRGGQARAAAAREGGAWMRPIFEAAYRQLEADCGRQLGRARLALTAQRILLADPSHPDYHRRKQLTPARARRYLESRITPLC